MASVSISDYQDVTWLPWVNCSYTDSLAIFRCLLTDIKSVNSLTTSLQPDEIDRANRFYRAADRDRFIIGRHLLRLLLAQYTNQSPNTIAIATGKNRKPKLPDNLNCHFNISHSGDWLLVAIAQNPIGIDVEAFNPAFDFQAILPTSFSFSEQQFIQSHEAPISAFYRLWTRKEGLLKATGKGLDDDFPNIPSLDGLHQLNNTLLGAPGDWLVQSFGVTADYPAAVAYPTGLETPKFYTVESGFFAHFTS